MIFMLSGLLSILILILFIGAVTKINAYKERKIMEYGEKLLFWSE